MTEITIPGEPVWPALLVGGATLVLGVVALLTLRQTRKGIAAASRSADAASESAAAASALVELETERRQQEERDAARRRRADVVATWHDGGPEDGSPFAWRLQNVEAGLAREIVAFARDHEGNPHRFDRVGLVGADTVETGGSHFHAIKSFPFDFPEPESGFWRLRVEWVTDGERALRVFDCKRRGEAPTCVHAELPASFDA